jgi:hypothetical protein
MDVAGDHRQGHGDLRGCWAGADHRQARDRRIRSQPPEAVLLSEAFRLVGDGYVTPQDLDKTLKDGLGLRWSFMGPFETIELNAPGGIPDYCRRYGASLSALSRANPAIYDDENLARILSQWEKVLTPDQVVARMRWRDRRLAALKAHQRSQPDG